MFEMDPESPLVVATMKDLNDETFVESAFLNMADLIFEKLKEAFGIRKEIEKVTAILEFARLLESPMNPFDSIPKFLMPARPLPADLICPHFDRHTLSIEDAVLQVFVEKRFNVALRIMKFLDSVCDKLDSRYSIRFDLNALPLNDAPTRIEVDGYPSNSCVSVRFDALFLQFGFNHFEIGDFCSLVDLEKRILLPIEVIRIVTYFNVLVKLHSKKLQVMYSM
jgi:hypothetical protein